MRNPSNRLANRLAPAFGVAAALALAAPAMAQSGKDIVVMASPTDVASWDPIAVTQAPAMPLFKAVFDQPLDQGPDLKLLPGIIKSYRWLEEGKTIEVTLRDDIRFHNGDKLTTEDFKYTYIDRLRADNKLALTGAVGNKYKDIEIVSPTVAIVHLSTPFPTALQWWAFLANFVVPKKYMTEVGVEQFVQKPVGSGPYRLVEYERGSRIVFEANDNYWGPKAKTRRVVVQIVKDMSARAAAIQTKQVDIAYDITLREAVRLGGLSGLKAVIEPITNVIMLQIRNDGVTADENVRLAMHHAINKQAISRALYDGKAVPISFLGVPGMTGEPKGYTFPYDVQKAKDLLAKSGYSPEKPAKITLMAFRGNFPGDWELANILVQQWKQVGVDATIEQIEPPQYYELNHNGKLKEATLFNWANATADPEGFTGFIMNPKLRFSAWKSKDMEDAMGPLFVEMNYDKRIAEYTRLNRTIVEKGYSIPVLQQVGTMVVQTNVTVPWYQSSWIRLSEISKQ